MSKRYIRKRLKSYSIQWFVQYSVEAFANDLKREMEENGTGYCILDEKQIEEWLGSVGWLGKSGKPQDIDVRGLIRNRGVKYYGEGGGFYVFYIGDKPTIGDNFRRRVVHGFRRIRENFKISDGFRTGGVRFPTFTRKLNLGEDVIRSEEILPKKFLFVGGVHGVGKSTFLYELRESYDGKIGLLGQQRMGRADRMFRHRNQIRNTVQVYWYSAFANMLVDAMYDPTVDRFLVDRTIFDFLPYSPPLSGHLIRDDSVRLLQFLRDCGNEIHQVFFFNDPEVVQERVMKRNRENIKEEVESIEDVMQAFETLSKEFDIPMIRYDTLQKSKERLLNEFPSFFEV